MKLPDRLVVDASALCRALIPDEADGPSRAMLRHIDAVGALAPPIWRFEVGATLVVAERRARMTRQYRLEALSVCLNLPIEEIELSRTRLFVDCVALADRHRLTVYDASYLWTALTTGFPLATADKSMRRAAEAEGIEVL